MSAVGEHSTPELLRLRAGARRGRYRISGELVICAPDPEAPAAAVRYEPSADQAGWLSRIFEPPPALPAVIPADGPVRLRRALLFPPFLNTVLLIEGAEGLVAVQLFGRRRRPVLEALAAAGVEVHGEWSLVDLAEHETAWGGPYGGRPV